MDGLKFEISRIELKENKYGKNDLLISQIKVMDKDGKYIKFAQLNDELIAALKESKSITIKK